jgi:hypothetical protein
MTLAMPNLNNLASPFAGLSTATAGVQGSTPSIMKKPVVPTMQTPTPTLALSTAGGLNMSMLSGMTGVAKPLVPMTTTTNTQGIQPTAPMIKTTPSGTIVNSATGGVIKPSGSTAPVIPTRQVQPTQQNYAIGTGAVATPPVNITGDSSTAPVIPNVDTSVYNSPMYTSPTYESALKSYQSLATPSDQESQNLKDIANLQQSLRTAYTNTEGQAIPLEFITGQKSVLEKREANLEQPLIASANMLQARRTAALDASKTVLDSEANKISAYRDVNKPTSVAFGSSLINPSTGKSVFGGNGAGSPMDMIGKAISEGRLSADQVTRYGAAAISSTLEKDPGYNFVTQKASIGADTDSLKKNQVYLDTTTRAYNTATDNMNNLTSFMTQNGINDSSIPVINQLTNKLKAGVLDPAAVAAFRSNLEGLRAEYAQVLSRGGQVTDSSRSSANALIPDNISPAQLKKVSEQLSIEGQNAIKEATKMVGDIKGRMGSGNSKSTGNNSSIGTSWDNL